MKATNSYTHLAVFLTAYNFARSIKTLGGRTPYEYISKIRTSEPDRLIRMLSTINGTDQQLGLNPIVVA